MQFCGDLPLFILLADNHARYIAPCNEEIGATDETIVTIKTIVMAAINTRPRRRNGLIGRNGLKKRVFYV